MTNAMHSVFSWVPAFTVVARRYYHAPKNSSWMNLVTMTCDDENEAKAIAIELSGTEGAEEVVISRPAFGTPFGGEPAYFRRIELSDEV